MTYSKNFEDFLMEKCDCHTNNSPEGFERWLENMDLQEMQDFAEEWGVSEYLRGKEEVMGKIEPQVDFMKDLLNGIYKPLELLTIKKQEEQDEIQEDTTSMEEKLEALDNLK